MKFKGNAFTLSRGFDILYLSFLMQIHVMHNCFSCMCNILMLQGKWETQFCNKTLALKMSLKNQANISILGKYLN